MPFIGLLFILRRNLAHYFIRGIIGLTQIDSVDKPLDIVKQ